MEINEINKQLYEAAFIENGEFGYHGNNWTPSIDEREIETMCCGEDGNYVPATPLGYRDYNISRIQGLQNIFDQIPCIDLTEDKFHHLVREENTIKQYDKIKTDKGDFIVCGDSEEQYFVVNKNNHLFCVDYVKRTANEN